MIIYSNLPPQVALIGAAGGIGQPLSLLLKLDPLVSELRLLDVINTPGVAADLSHIPTPARVVGYKGASLLSLQEQQAIFAFAISDPSDTNYHKR